MKLRASLAAAALVAAGGSIGAVQAAGAAEPPASPSSPADLAAPIDLPRFVPSAEPAEAEEPTLAAEWLDPDDAVIEDIPDGLASWYGPGFAGRRTASGERFDPGEYTAAHRTLPFGSKVRVTRGDRSVVVRINDRGPFHGGRVIDLSQAAAAELGLIRAGSGHVELALLED